jgi:dipeptidyl aminopeptidase/acylaminoacyl peptidase
MDKEDHNGDERDRLFRVDIDNPGSMIPLTDANPAYFLRGGSLHPDGRTLFYGANYDFASRRPLEATWIYRHDLLSGERRPIACPHRPVNMDVSLNRQGTHLLYSRKDRHPSGRQFHLVDQNGDQDRELIYFGDPVKTFARWFPDGENILVISESTGDTPQGFNSLGIYHWPSGKLRWVVNDERRRIEAAWVSPDGLVIVDEIWQARHVVSWIDPADGKENSFPSFPGNLLPIGRAADEAWIALHFAANRPTDLVRFVTGPHTLEGLVSLTHFWDHGPLRLEDLVPAVSISWQSYDGLLVQGWLYRAQPNPKRAVIHIHGGPTDHAQDLFDPQIHYLVSRGFNVLDVNYRGSTGFGLGFREAIKEDGWGGREQEDIVTGAETLIHMGLAEPGRVGVTGTSYGGYSAWCQITRFPTHLIAAAVPICGMTDLRLDYETTRPDLRPYSEEMIGGSPADIPEKYAERSPINFIHNISSRLLIVQGARDPNVTPQHVHRVCQSLDAFRIPYDVLVFEDEGHGISKPANEAVLYQKIADFFDTL